MTTQEQHIQAEIRAFKEQVRALEDMSRAGVAKTPRLDTLTLDEAASNIIDATVRQADFDIQRRGIAQAITFFNQQIAQRQSKLAELQESARIAQLEQDYAEGLIKMEQLQAKLEQKRAELADIVNQINECANNSKYSVACLEITDSQWWNTLSYKLGSAPILTQFSNKITWGLGMKSLEGDK